MDEKLLEQHEYAAALNGPNKRKYILGRIPYTLAMLEKLIPMLEAAALAQKATGSAAAVEEVGSADWVPETNARYRVAFANESNVADMQAFRDRQAAAAKPEAARQINNPYTDPEFISNVMAAQALVNQAIIEREQKEQPGGNAFTEAA